MGIILSLLALVAIGLGVYIFRYHKVSMETSLDIQEDTALAVRQIARNLSSIGNYVPKTQKEHLLNDFLGDAHQAIRLSRGIIPIAVLLEALLDKGWIVMKEYHTYSREDAENAVCLYCEAPVTNTNPEEQYSLGEYRLVLEVSYSTVKTTQLKGDIPLNAYETKDGSIDIASDIIIHATSDCDTTCRTDLNAIVMEIYKNNQVKFNFTNNKVIPGQISIQSYNHTSKRLVPDTMVYLPIPIAILNKSYSEVRIGTVHKRAGDFVGIFKGLHAKRRVNTLITGGLGTGKTTLAQSLLNEVSSAATIVSLSIRQFEQIMTLGELFQDLRKAASEGKKYVLYFDEAQILTKEIASELGEIMDGKNAHENISVVIVTSDAMDPDVKEVLLRPGRTHIEVNLNPLTVEQWTPLVGLIEAADKTKKWKYGPVESLTLAQIHNNFGGTSIEEDVSNLEKEVS